jgi:thymidylate synthase ThyX
MAIAVKILADSLAPCGTRCVTLEGTYPRSIHSEILTHKMLSRNSASSRAIPTEKLIQRVVDDPFVPMYIGANQKGMQAGAELALADRAQAERIWLDARSEAVIRARAMLKLGVHKQVINRVIEPFMWMTTIISATSLDNFFGLRCHEAAEPHFQHFARMARDAMAASAPRKLTVGEWHLPLIDDAYDRQEVAKVAGLARGPGEDTAALDLLLAKVSVGRCARVSYLTHDGTRDVSKDIELHDQLMVQSPLHASPAEHVAQALDWPAWFKSGWRPSESLNLSGDPWTLQNRVLQWRCDKANAGGMPPMWILVAETALAQMRSGNFMGFAQYRKRYTNEHIGGLMP